MLEEALSFWNAIKGKVREAIREDTRNAVRMERYDVTTAPNGTKIGVSQPFGDEIFVPYSAEVANAQVGDTVLLVWWNSLSTAKAYYFGDGYNGGAVQSVGGKTGAVEAPVYLGLNPTTNASADTPAFWGGVGTGWAYYNATGRLVDQPTQWGVLVNYWNSSTRQVSQMFFAAQQAYVYVRRGDSASTTWIGTWARLINIDDFARTAATPSANVSCANNTWTTICQITLPAGRYSIHAIVNFAANSVGNRQAIITNTASGTSAISRYLTTVVAPAPGANTVVHVDGTYQISAQTTLYLRALQTSGGALNATSYSGLEAVKIPSRDYGG